MNSVIKNNNLEITKGSLTTIDTTYLNSVERHFYNKYGHIVVLELTLTLQTAFTDDVSNGYKLFSGAPASANNATRFILHNTFSGSSLPIRLEVTTSGIIQTCYTPFAQVGQYTAVIAYITS